MHSYQDGGNEGKILYSQSSILNYTGTACVTPVLRVFFFLCFVSLFLCRETKKKEMKEGWGF